MSLINQMLRDLERRQADDGRPAVDTELPLMYASPSRQQYPWRYLLALAVAATAYWLSSSSHDDTLRPSAPPVQTTVQVGHLSPTPQPTAALPAQTPQPAAPLAEQPQPAMPAATPTPTVPVSVSAPIQAKTTAPPRLPQAVPQRKPESAKPAGNPQREAVVRQPDDDAEGLFRRAARLVAEGEATPAQAMLERALREQPGHTQARALLGRLLIQQGDWNAAAEVLDSGAAPATDGELAQLRARVLLHQGRAEQAIAVLEAARARAPADGKTLGMLGAAYHDQGRYAEAAATYRQALRQQPSESRWWLGLAVALDSDRHYPEALQAYREVLARRGLESRVLSYARERVEALEAPAER